MSDTQKEKKWLPFVLESGAQLVGASSLNQKVVCFIPGQGTYLGCGFNPRSGYLWKATN